MTALRPAILFCALMCAAARAAATNTPAVASGTNGSMFAFAPGHFAFLLPSYWTAVSDDKVQVYKDSLRKLYPGRPVPNYVLGIQRKALLSFTLPYALVELDNCGMPNPAQVELQRSAFAGTIVGAYLQLHREGLFGEVKPMDAIYYTNAVTHVIMGYWHMVRSSDKQKLACVSAIYPCGYGYVRFHFFMDAGTQDADLPVIEQIIQSVAFDQGFAYAPKAAPSAAEVKLRSMRTMIVMVVIVMAVWLVVRLLVRPRTRGTPAAGNPYSRRTP